MLKSEKIVLVKDLENLYSKSKMIVFIHYQGLRVRNINVIKSYLRERGVVFKIVKNKLFNIAVNNGSNGQCDVKHFLKGPVGLVYSEKDDITVANSVKNIVKAFPGVEILGGIFDQQSVEVDFVNKLASLKSLNHYRAQLIGILQAPAAKIVGVTNAVNSKIARLCSLYIDKFK